MSRYGSYCQKKPSNAIRSTAFILAAKVIFLTAFSLYFTFFLIKLTKNEVNVKAI